MVIMASKARLAAAADPENVMQNFTRLRAMDRTVTLQQVKDRAAYPHTRIRVERAAALRIEISDRVQKPDQARTVEIVLIHM